MLKKRWTRLANQERRGATQREIVGVTIRQFSADSIGPGWAGGAASRSACASKKAGRSRRSLTMMTGQKSERMMKTTTYAPLYVGRLYQRRNAGR